MTVEEVLLEYLHSRQRDLARLTQKRYIQAAERISRSIGTIEARHLSLRILDKYVSDRWESVGTDCIKLELIILSSALKLARRRGDWNGTWADIAPSVPSDGSEQRTRWLSVDEVRQFVDGLPGDRADWVWLACYTGMRISEVNDTTWAHIDLDERTLRVPGTKSKHARGRFVPLAPAILSLLRSRRAAGLPPVTPWMNPYGTITRHSANMKAGRIIPHDLRRTFASWLLQAGVQERAIADMLGHGGTELVRTVYAHLGPEHLRAAVARLPDVGPLASRVTTA